jgi:exopolyphosphatase/guanosine-5'-triphosphate,3'-diphosphate pyrophosphatase
MRVAAIDIGTNSVLLLVAERRGGELVAVVERATITRLGQGVDASRALSDDAVERTLACLERYADEARALGVERLDVVGTSAMRDARGGERFRARAAALLGVEPRVISGDEEARLTFEGAISGLGLADDACAVFDVGGGSTEIIAGPGGGAVSLDVGSVRLTERHVRSDPPAPGELEAARADARAALATLPEGLTRRARALPLVGVAGTVTTLVAVARGIVPYDGARVHGARLTRAELDAARGALASRTLAERRALPGLEPARADVIVAGAVLVGEIVAWARGEGSVRGEVALVASDRGVRWGLAQRLAC